MRTVKAYPPNIDLIRLALGVSDEVAQQADYCHGDTIYNPSGKELASDIIFHEHVHSQQQGSNPDLWWNRYLTDKAFRLEQEIEAYGRQYAFVCEHIPVAKIRREMLDSMAFALSGEGYGKLLSYGEAESKIRNYGR